MWPSGQIIYIYHNILYVYTHTENMAGPLHFSMSLFMNKVLLYLPTWTLNQFQIVGIM